MQGGRLLLWFLQFCYKQQFPSFLDGAVEVFGCLSGKHVPTMYAFQCCAPKFILHHAHLYDDLPIMPA